MTNSALRYGCQRQSHHEPWTTDGCDKNAKAMTASPMEQHMMSEMCEMISAHNCKILQPTLF